MRITIKFCSTNTTSGNEFVHPSLLYMYRLLFVCECSEINATKCVLYAYVKQRRFNVRFFCFTYASSLAPFERIPANVRSGFNTPKG